MSELRVAVVAEGRCDYPILKALVESFFDGDTVVTSLQPDVSASRTFHNQVSPDGWVGVYNWAKATTNGGVRPVSKTPVLRNADVLIVHLDADVAGMTYESGRVSHSTADLPCNEPCPPCDASVNALRNVLLRWLGEAVVPSRVVLVTPSMNMDAWVVYALNPNAPPIKRKGAVQWECHRNPAGQLATIPKPMKVKPGDAQGYAARCPDIVRVWPQLAADLSQAGRFEAEFRKAARATR